MGIVPVTNGPDTNPYVEGFFAVSTGLLLCRSVFSNDSLPKSPVLASLKELGGRGGTCKRHSNTQVRVRLRVVDDI